MGILIPFVKILTMLFIREGVGGLFDFNATLPLMALQFVALMIILTFILYKPTDNVLERREKWFNEGSYAIRYYAKLIDEQIEENDRIMREGRLVCDDNLLYSEKEAKRSKTSSIRWALEEAEKTKDSKYKYLKKIKKIIIKRIQKEGYLDNFIDLLIEKIVSSDSFIERPKDFPNL